MALPNNLSSLGSIANAMFNSMSANSTAVTSMTVGGTTINASGVSGNSNVFVGNSTVNAVVSSNGFVVGNSTVNAVVNSTAFTVANSTVTYSYTAPTSIQQSNTTFFLNANGSWATAGGTGGANTTITSSNTLTASSLKIVSVSMANVGQSITLPAATTLTTGGPIFALVNKSSNIEFGIRDASGALIAAVGPNGDGECYLEDNSTAAGTWSVRGSNLLPAIRSLEYIFGSTYRATSGYNAGSGYVDIIIRLSDTLSVGVVKSTTGQAYVFAINHSTSPDTIGTPVLVSATIATSPFLYKITATKAALMIVIGGIVTAYNIAVSGTTCTVSSGVTTSYIYENNYSKTKFNNFGISYVATVGTNRDVLVFLGYGGGYNYAQAFDFSGTNPIAGTAVDITRSSSPGSVSYLGELSSTAVLSVYYDSDGNSQYVFRILTISGTTITAGTAVLGGGITDTGGSIFQLSSNSVITYRGSYNGSNYVAYYKPFQISGTTITPNSSFSPISSNFPYYPPIGPYFTAYSNTIFSVNYNDASYKFDAVFSCTNGGAMSNTNLGYLTGSYNYPAYTYRTQALSNNSFLYVTDSSGSGGTYGGNKVLTEINLSGNTFSNGNVWMFPSNAKPVGGLTSFGNNGLTIYRSIPASSNNISTDFSFSAFRYTSSGVRFLGINAITLPNLTSRGISDIETTALSSVTDNYTTSNGSNKFTIAGSTNLIGIAPANTTYANSALRNTPMINVLEFIV